MNQRLAFVLLVGLTVNTAAQDYSLNAVTPHVRDGAVNWCRKKMAAEGKPFDSLKPEASCNAKEMLLGYSRERAADLKKRKVKPKKFDAKIEADKINKRRANEPK